MLKTCWHPVLPNVVKQHLRDLYYIFQLMRSVAAKFRGGNVSDEDIQRGKASLISHILMDYEKSEDMLECLGVQGLLIKKCKTPQELIQSIESVSPADVNNVGFFSLHQFMQFVAFFMIEFEFIVSLSGSQKSGIR